MGHLFQLFQGSDVRYCEGTFTTRVTFKKKLQPKIHPSSKSLSDFLALEKQIHGAVNKDLTLSFSRIINGVFKQGHQIDLIWGNTNLESIAMGSVSESGIRGFDALYHGDKEHLSPQFNHVATDHLRDLKYKLVALLGDGKLTEKVVVERKDHCQHLLKATQQLILSAKTVSAVIASVAYSARVFTQLGVVKQGMFHDTAIFNLFKESIPQVFAQQKMTLGSRLNTVGSAWQLECVREQLMAKLQDYLSRRARLVNETVTEEAHSGEVLQSYQMLDRGFFYNKTLQAARVTIAARLLLQIERYQLCDRDGGDSKEDLDCNSQEDRERKAKEIRDRKAKNGATIDTAQHFAQALTDAIEDNRTCYQEKGRFVDQLGELYVILDEARRSMASVYTQNVQVSRSSCSLMQQLGFETINNAPQAAQV